MDVMRLTLRQLQMRQAGDTCTIAGYREPICARAPAKLSRVQLPSQSSRSVAAAAHGSGAAQSALTTASPSAPADNTARALLA